MGINLLAPKSSDRNVSLFTKVSKKLDAIVKKTKKDK
jgi:hypothetical protein